MAAVPAGENQDHGKVCSGRSDLRGTRLPSRNRKAAGGKNFYEDKPWTALETRPPKMKQENESSLLQNSETRI
jgi:hypothetical protein